MVHAVLLLAAPLVSDLAGAPGRLVTGRMAPPIGTRWRAIVAAARTGSVIPPWSVVFAFGATVAASLLVPSFTTGMLTGPLDDLVVVAGLLGFSRLAMAAGLEEPAATGRWMGLVALWLPAMLLAGLALALISGSTGLDAAIAAAPGSAPVPLGLAVLALALAALADDGDGWEAGSGDGLVGPGLALALGTSSLRLLIWLDLVGALLPPWTVAAATAGPMAWAAGLLLWPVKIAVLALAVGVARSILAPARSAWRLSAVRAGALLALLGGVFVLVGQSFE